jgi:hypothetical protein
VHKTSSNLPLFIIVHVPRQESEQSCICICTMSINFESVSTLSSIKSGSPYIAEKLLKVMINTDTNNLNKVIQYEGF